MSNNSYTYEKLIYLFLIIGPFNLTIRGIIPLLGMIFYDVFITILFFYKLRYKDFIIRDEDILMFIYLCIGIILSFVDLSSGIYGFRITFYPVIFYIIVSNFFDSTRIKKSLKLIKVLGIIIATLGIIMYFFIPNEIIFSFAYKYHILTQLEGYFYYVDILRMMSIIWNPMAFGSLMMIMSILYFNDLINCNNLKGFIINIIPYVIILVCLIFSLSRGAWTASLAGHIFILTYKKRKIIPVIITGIMIFILFYYNFNNYTTNLYSHLSSLSLNPENGISAYAQRSSQWWNSIDLFMKYPLGYGVGRIGVAQQRLVDKYGASINVPQITDGNYFKILAETGIEGIVIFILFMIIKIIKSIKTIKKITEKNSKQVLVGIVGVIVGILLQGIGTNVWDFVYLPYLYYFIIAITNYYIRTSKNDFISIK